jgi:hypothetical protein
MIPAGNAVPAIIEVRKQGQSPATPTFIQAWLPKYSKNGYTIKITGTQNFGVGTKMKIAIA